MEYSAVSTIWIMVGTVLIFFMQAGFAMLETGMTRVKNAGNIAMKNLVDYCIGSVTFWLIGFGIMAATELYWVRSKVWQWNRYMEAACFLTGSHSGHS